MPDGEWGRFYVTKHEQLKRRTLSDPGVKAEYDALESEFALLREMLLARERTGLSQTEIADRMGTIAPAVARLESALVGGKQSPSLAMIKKYAKAVDCHIEIKLIHNSKSSPIK